MIIFWYMKFYGIKTLVGHLIQIKLLKIIYSYDMFRQHGFIRYNKTVFKVTTEFVNANRQENWATTTYFYIFNNNLQLYYMVLLINHNL